MKLTASTSQANRWSELSVCRDDSTVDMIILFSGGIPAAFAIISQAVAHVDDERFKASAVVRKHVLRWGGKRSRQKYSSEKFQALLASTLLERISFLKGQPDGFRSSA